MTDPTTAADRLPNPVAVRRITAHLWGEDIVDLRAAVESFANGWTVVEKHPVQDRPTVALPDEAYLPAPRTAAGRALLAWSDGRGGGYVSAEEVAAIEAEAAAPYDRRHFLATVTMYRERLEAALTRWQAEMKRADQYRDALERLVEARDVTKGTGDLLAEDLWDEARALLRREVGEGGQR